MCVCVCVCVSKISETTKYKALKKAKKSKFLCCAESAGYVIANCFTPAKVKHLFRMGKKMRTKNKFYNPYSSYSTHNSSDKHQQHP